VLDRSQVLLFAHRGGMAHAPENTLAAFANALSLGANALESDAWVTADAMAVLDHDGTVRRRWRRSPISALARAALPSHIPTLAELYQACGTDFDLALDVCDPRAAGAVLDTAAARGPGATSRLWLCDGDPLRLSGLRRLDPGVNLVLSSDSFRLPGEDLDEMAGRLEGLGLAALNLRARDCRRELVGACQRHGLRLFAWGARTVEEVEGLVVLGVDGVMGDDVGVLCRGLARARQAYGPR